MPSSQPASIEITPVINCNVQEERFALYSRTVSISLYDAKPVYFLTSACEEIKWTKKEKKVYSPTSWRKIKVPFYRPLSAPFIKLLNHLLHEISINTENFSTDPHRNIPSDLYIHTGCRGCISPWKISSWSVIAAEKMQGTEHKHPRRKKSTCRATEWRQGLTRPSLYDMGRWNGKNHGQGPKRRVRQKSKVHSERVQIYIVDYYNHNGCQILLTNSYVLYCKYHKMMKSQKAVSHYGYIRMIAYWSPNFFPMREYN